MAESALDVVPGGSYVAPLVAGTMHSDDYYNANDQMLDNIGPAEYALPMGDYHTQHAVKDVEDGNLPGAVGQAGDAFLETTEEMLVEGICA
jgi:hypothetical protein